ncbi:MAG: tetratricopeptide repeat protein [Defluviitaleaceae bacterium]|nr:tetratricopeptide repeat protein [Defluviitaleaceae bacterium]
MTDNTGNSEAYAAIRWAIDNGNIGFFFVFAPPRMQREIAVTYKSLNSAIYDCSKEENKPYSYAKLSQWVDEHEEQNILFIINMDAALHEENNIAALNMSRDMLARKEKMWFFSMTENMANRLMATARDFYSYARLKIRFQPEADEEFEGMHIKDFDNRHNVQQIKETLNRYKELEERYMAMSVEKNTRNELLSAAIALIDIATLYRDCAEYENALKLLEKTREIREGQLEPEHPDIATTYNNIAFMYDEQANYDVALHWYQKALAINEKVFGKEHPNTATTYNNIALVYSHQKEYDTALHWYQKALSIREKVLGNNHIDTADIYNNMALMHCEQGDYNNALEGHFKDLGIVENILDKEHPHIAISYNNIAVVYRRQQDYDNALKWFQKALSIYEKVRGKEHPDTATTYNNMALVFDNQGDYNKALELYQKSYEIYLNKLGEEHPYTITAKENIQAISNMK